MKMRDIINLCERDVSHDRVPRSSGPGHNHGFDVDAFHGTNQDFSAFAIGKNGAGSSGSREGPIGIWFTDNPETATGFASWASRGQAGGNVLPVRLRMSNPWVVQSYQQIKDLIDRFTTFERPGYIIGGSQIRMRGDKIDYDAARDWLKGEGYDGIALLNTHTDSPDEETAIHQYVVFDPSQIRSRFAKFDPDKLASPEISEDADQTIPPS